MPVRTIEDITVEMTNLVDGAVDRSLTDEEVTNYEALETELKSVQATNAIRTRNGAYNSVVIPAGVPQRGTPVRDSQDLAFENYLRTGRPNSDLIRVTDLDSKGYRPTNAQSEGSSAAGGYLVPQGFRDKIVEVRKAFGGFLNNVESLNTSTGQPLEWPSNDDTANSGDITAESAAITSGNDLVFGTVALGAYKYTSTGGGSNLPLRVPVELLQDSFFDLEGFISKKLAQRIHRKQAVDAVTGNGVGRPQGILYPALTSDRDLATPDTIVYADLVNLQDQLDEEYDANAKWLMRKNTWSQIRLVVDTTGRPLVQPSTEGISERPIRKLLDKEVIIDEAAPLNSSAGITFPIAYGDFVESYVWRTVSDFVVIVNPYNRASNGEVEFTAWERADGVVQNRNSYKVIRNNT
jgi:HK97 family phage major capsid protein